MYLYSVLVLLISTYTENNPDLLELIGQICAIYSYMFVFFVVPEIWGVYCYKEY